MMTMLISQGQTTEVALHPRQPLDSANEPTRVGHVSSAVMASRCTGLDALAARRTTLAVGDEGSLGPRRQVANDADDAVEGPDASPDAERGVHRHAEEDTNREGHKKDDPAPK